MSIGGFGSAAAARSEANSILSRGAWPRGTQEIAVHAIGIYQRDPNDGKFYAVSSIPLLPRPKNVVQCSTRDFLRDAGALWSHHMRGVCVPALFDVERTCQAAVASQTDGQMEAKVQVYGSHAMNASLATLSDVDAVIEVRPTKGASNSDQKLRCVNSSKLLLNVASRFKVGALYHVANIITFCVQYMYAQ